MIHNQHTDPLNILKAGIYQDTVGNRIPVYISNPKPAFAQTDSTDKRSYIRISHKTPFPVDRLSFILNDPQFYKREARLLVPSEKGRAEDISFFTLSSDTTARISLDGNKYTGLLLIIENEDSPPLKLEAVESEQLQKHLVAYLEKGERYTLITGNPQASRPRYDLTQFNDRIPQTLSGIAYSDLVVEESIPVRSSFRMNYFLWIVVAAGVVMLGILTYKLVEDMKKTRI